MDIQQQKKYKILLIGDSCQDLYHYGTCERISPEAPVLILKETYLSIKDGMSLNVKQNLLSYNCFEIEHITNKNKIKKHRFVDEKTNQHLLRVDEGESSPLKKINKKTLKAILQTKNNYDALIISDYNKGFLTNDVCLKLTEAFKEIPIFVDSKKQDLSCFKNCFLKINEKEYREAIKLDKSSRVIVTLGKNGAQFEDKVFPAEKVEVFDVCGAGDVFLSCLVFKYLNTLDIIESIKSANKVAAFSVTKSGTYVLNKKELNDLHI